MLQRWLVAIIGLPLLLAVLLACPPWATMLLVAAISGVAAYELLHVAGKNVEKIYASVTTAAVLQEIYCFIETQQGRTLIEGVSSVTLFRWVLVMVLFACAVASYGTEKAMPFSVVCVGIMGGIIFPAMYACIFLLRLHEPYGRLYVLAPFFIAFAGDSLAMYFGKWFGKRKLTPVSPNKTWAGFWGGILGSALGMLLLGFIGDRWLGYAPNYPLLALAGAAANPIGQLGDLSTSLVKREAGVKDYSRLFLTHGGMLDRFDSTLFLAPVVYFFVTVGII